MTMKIITRQSLAEAAKDSWFNQYRSEIKYGSAKPTLAPNGCADVYNNLCAIEDVTPEKVNDIIGNDSWTKVSCDQCGKFVDAIIELGEESDYESRTVHICFDCMVAAMDKFNKEVNK